MVKVKTKNFHMTELIVNDSHTAAVGKIQKIKTQPVCSFVLDRFIEELQQAKQVLGMGVHDGELYVHIWENNPAIVTIHKKNSPHPISKIGFAIAPATNQIKLKRHDDARLPDWLWENV